MQVDIGEWRLDVDAVATQAVYAKTERGSPADCDCLPCANFAALGVAVYPAEFRAWAERLGIDLGKAAEVCHPTQFADPLLEYTGWFHAVGEVVAGRTDSGWSPRVPQWPWLRVTDHFQLVIDRRRDLAFDEFADRPLVRLEFSTRQPWVLSEAYPG